MDDLQLIIKSLTATEQKEFRQFIQRNRFKAARKDLDLFNLLAQNQNVDKASIVQALYGEEFDRNNYHGTRKRLASHLNDFIYLNQIEDDESLEGTISKQLILIRHLFNHQLSRLAWKQLRKTEKIARSAELNYQLQLIYELQIKHYDSDYIDRSLDELVNERKVFAELAREDQNMKIIGSFVKQELEKVKIQAKELDLNRVIDLLLNTFEMQDSLFRRPKLRYNFVRIARSIILANKEFYAFEEYVIDNYNKIDASGYFDSRPSHRVNMLYIITHTLYRNKKFDDAIQYLDELGEYLNQVGKAFYNRMNPRYFLLRAACENFRGNLDLSIRILEDMLEKKIVITEDEFNAKLNLAVYCFEQKAYKAANQTLQNLGHTDNWLEKNMGIEWRIKKNMIDVIFQYELGRTEIALDRIQSLERIHGELFKTKKYSRVVVFLRLIKEVIKNPHEVQSAAYLEKVETSFEWIEKEKEDLQAMSYYAWLKSKMTKRDFYEVLLELITGKV